MIRQKSFKNKAHRDSALGQKIRLRMWFGDFPGDPVVKSSPSRQGAMIPCALWQKNQNIEQKQHCTKFNKDFKTGPHQKNLWEKKKNVALS